MATDGSTPSRAAELFAAEMAGLMAADQAVVDVVVCMVVRPRDLPAGRGAFGLWPLTDEELEHANRLVEEAAERVKAKISSSGTVNVRPTIVEMLRPADGIVEAAHADGTCSLIVMGNRGQGGISSMMLGSVSQQVLHSAHCPVVIIKE